MKKLLKKLKSTRGESISETLISSLVIALGFIIAVTMIVSATNMVSKASTSWNKYYDEKNKLEGHQIKKGDRVVFASVGSGMNINAMVYNF